MTISIILNGAPHSVEQGKNLQELIDSLELPPQAMAVAVNRKVISRPQWLQHMLQPNDLVDIVRAIGGG